ncbi:hypothetical protein [Profundibacter sp.]
MNNHQFTGLGFLDPMRGVCHGPLAPLVASIGAISPAIMAGGTILGAVGAIQQGKAAQASAEYSARQFEAQGKAERASAQRKAINEGKQKDLVMSRARAVGASSGGGLDLELMGDIEEEGTYRSLTALWEGEERAKGRNAQAAAQRASGAAANRAGGIKAFSTILSGGSSLMDKYG